MVTDPYINASALTNPTRTGGNTDNILEKGETWTYTGNYTVLQSDLDNNGKLIASSGIIRNTASVVTTELPSAKTATSDVNIILTPSMSLTKVADNTGSKAGDNCIQLP